MKESKYNFIYDFDLEPNKKIFYNSRTNALALVEEENYTKWIDFTQEEKDIDDEELLSNLKEGGYLIEDEIDELKLLKYSNLKSKYSEKNLMLTIAPTLACNFECIYCFEKNNRIKSIMDDVTKEKVIELVDNQLKYLDSFSVTWYGGEPLLYPDIILELESKFKKMCDEKNVKYSSTMISNGYLLNKDVAKQLKEYGLTHIQITLDGVADVHDKRRPLVGGQKTFEKIIENVINCCEDIQIVLRVNVDKENYNGIYEIIKILEENNVQDKVYIYLGYVEPANDCYITNKCMEFCDFAELSFDFEKKLKEKGITKEIMHRYPQIKFTYCGADTNNAFVIDPYGYLYKCWTDIGMIDRAIGNLNDDSFKNKNSYKIIQDYVLYESTEDAECIECKFMPICLGGCPRKRVDKLVDRCTEYKYNLGTYIKAIANEQYLKSNKE